MWDDNLVEEMKNIAYYLKKLYEEKERENNFREMVYKEKKEKEINEILF